MKGAGQGITVKSDCVRQAHFPWRMASVYQASYPTKVWPDNFKVTHLCSFLKGWNYIIVKVTTQSRFILGLVVYIPWYIFCSFYAQSLKAYVMNRNKSFPWYDEKSSSALIRKVVHFFTWLNFCIYFQIILVLIHLRVFSVLASSSEEG